jgi:hypothetical protein
MPWRPSPGERLVEVGPGRGALTWAFSSARKRLDVIEIDRDLAQTLKPIPGPRTARGARRERARHGLSSASRLGRAAARRRQSSLQHFDAAAVSLLTAARRHFRHVFHAAKRGRGSDGGAARNQELRAIDRDARRGRRGRRIVRCRPRRISAAAQGLVGDRALRPTRKPRFEAGGGRRAATLVTAAFSHRRKTLRNWLKGLLSRRTSNPAESIRNCARKRWRRRNSACSPRITTGRLYLKPHARI